MILSKKTNYLNTLVRGFRRNRLRRHREIFENTIALRVIQRQHILQFFTVSVNHDII